MKTRALLGALLVFGAALSAQAPAPAVAAPKIPKGPTKAEFRIGGFMVSGERNYDYYNTVSSAKGSIRGVEVLLRGSGAGLYVRSLSGTFGKQPKVISADARILLFPPVFTIFAGVGKRGLSGLVDKVYDFITAGVSSTVNIGGTGLRTHISGGILLAPDKSASGAAAVKQPSKGIEAEAAVFYRLPRVPFFMMVGYRAETFTGMATSGTTVTKSPEEVRGLRFGGGIQFGGH
jgi:hypothetical protein